MELSQIPKRVRHALQHGESPASLATKAGLHRNTLYGCEGDRWNPTFETLKKLAAIFSDEDDSEPPAQAAA
jgi:DNA-binding XRE family transcriptional regulator